VTYIARFVGRSKQKIWAWVAIALGTWLATVIVLGEGGSPQVKNWSTPRFDAAVAQSLKQTAKINAAIVSGPTVSDTSFTQNGLPAWFYYPLLILSGLPQSSDATVVHGIVKSSRFYQVHHWLAVAALRTPGTWDWTTSSKLSSPARADVKTLAEVLRYYAIHNSTPSTLYDVKTSDALHGAEAIAVTTVPLKGTLLNQENRAMGPVAMASVCHALKATSARTHCNSLTVLWVRPRPGVAIRAY
jgi:hypothetical protein